MRTRWRYECSVCKAPLNVSLDFDHEHELDWVCSWHAQKPLILAYNIPIYKAIGGRAHRMCLACYDYQNSFSMAKYIRERETSGKPPPPQEYHSLSKEGLDSWMKEAVSYSKDPKADFTQAPMTLVFLYWIAIPGLYSLNQLW